MTGFRKTVYTTLFIFLIFPVFSFSEKMPELKSDALVLKKPDVIISNFAIRHLSSTAAEKARIWVFYNDKGIFSKSSFDIAAENIVINDHARKRRTKAGITDIVYADLPVYENYIEQIIALGAEHRRNSRWLNASSFEIDKKLVDEITQLPFVNKIIPVATYKRIEPEDDNNNIRVPKFNPTQPDMLNYGESINQIQQINAHLLHQMGYTGEGVIVGMLDTGYRKTHTAFAQAYNENRVLAEYDFIFNDGDTQNDEIIDDPSQHNHGTYCWSTLGGYAPGDLIGPAYGASFLLAKTEDIRDEYPAEEDNWVAALEWTDSFGADVVSTSLSYKDWYTYEDFDGATCVTTLAANMAAGLGILVTNSIGNSGPDSGTLGAPSDAHDMLACGAVDGYGTIAYFSSRGPSSDGRTKPEVCAQGSSTRCAGGSGDNDFTYKSGTSLSTPLVGGAAAVLLSAHPDWSAYNVRKALMETAGNASTPDNTYGWGVIDMMAAYNWGANFTADTIYGNEGLVVHFSDSSISSASSWKWYFGDGDSSGVQNPVHTFIDTGAYDVTLIIDSDEGVLSRVKEGYITIVHWDGIRGDANNNGAISLLDITYLIAFLYKGGPGPITLVAGDADANLTINLMDLTYLIAYLYKDGPPPPP